MVDFVMGRKQAISKTEDAVLKFRYQGTEKNFKFLFGLLCCASRKSPFPPLFLHFYPFLLYSLSLQGLSYDVSSS